MSEVPEVLTIGHSNHSLDAFVELLQQHRVTAVADVRSAPYSKYNPQFNREPLERALKGHDIAYSFLGSELGARPKNSSCYDQEDRVRFEVLEKTEEFQHGIERIMKGTATYRIALMCGERDPSKCHRAILVAPGLLRHGATVQHILADGSLETHDRSLGRRPEAKRMAPLGIFGPDALREERRVRAGRRIAYRAAAGERGTS